MIHENDLLDRLDKIETQLRNLDKVMTERVPHLITEQLEKLFEEDRHIVMDRTQYLRLLAELEQRRRESLEARQLKGELK